MFNYRCIIAATVIALCIMGVITVIAENAAGNTQFTENPSSFFSPSPSQSNQYADSQFPESSPHIHLHTAPVIAPSYTNLWDFSFDLTGTPTDYRKEFEDRIQQGDYIYRENDTTCGNCVPVPGGSSAYSWQKNQYILSFFQI